MTDDDETYPFPGPDPDGEPAAKQSGVFEEYDHGCRIVREHREADPDLYHYENALGRVKTFEKPEKARLYADVATVVRGFREEKTGERGVPPAVAASELASRCFRWRKDMQRKRYTSDEGRGNTTNRLRRIWAEMSNLVARYGDSPWRVVGTSAFTVMLFSLIYPHVGGMQSTEGEGQVFAFDTLFAIPEHPLTWSKVLLANLYFSAVTFTTLGYGDIQPSGTVSQALASIESFLGAALLALLVAVLARRITR